jgi:predicted kinase
MELAEPEVPEEERAAAFARARAHWLLALGELEEAGRRPCLVLVGGLSGTGKSTLARSLAQRAGFAVIRSDWVRKQLAGLADGPVTASPFEAGIYSPEWTERTYAECRKQAEALLFEGRRVVVDASFRSEAGRRILLDRASQWGIPVLFFLCRAEPAVVRARLEGRRDDVSDADWSIYLRAAERWEEPAPLTRAVTHEIDTGQGQEESLARALEILRRLDLA